MPSEWAKNLNLKPGDEIDLIERGGTITLSAHQNKIEKSCEININDFTVPLLWRYFQSAYRAGCNEIKIIFDPSKKEYEDAYHYYTTQFEYARLGEKIPPKPALAMIQEVVNRFAGVDIIESGNSYCVIRELGEVSAKEFDNSLRRIFIIILQMFDRIKQAIAKNEIRETSLCKEIHTIDLNVDKFVDYCSRILNKMDYNFPEGKKSLIFSTLFILELVGDEFKYIGKHLALSKKPVKDTFEFVNLIKEHFELYYKLYYKFSRDLAIDFGRKDIEVYTTHFKIKEKLYGENRSIMKHLMMISKFTLALVELRIQMEFDL